MLAIFDMEKCKPPLSRQRAFQVQIFSKGKGIHRTVITKVLVPVSCQLPVGSLWVLQPIPAIEFH